MIAMRPVKEPEVIKELNAGRYEGELEGYVVMDGSSYLGHILYRIDDNVTYVLDAKLQDNNMLVDGAVRACVAAGQYKGATHFVIQSECDCLVKWREVFCKTTEKVENEKIFGQCK